MHGKRKAVGGVEDGSGSARDGVGEKPVRDHRGEVEGHDRGDDSEWLADLHFVHARCYVLEVVALHHHGNAAGNFDVFDGATKLGSGFGESFSIFESDDAGKIVEIFFEQVFQLEEVLDALAGRGAAPAREGIGAGLDSGVHVGGGRGGGGGKYFGGGGVGGGKGVWG